MTHESERNGKTVRNDTGETAQLLLFVNQLALTLFFDHDQNFVAEFQDLETDVLPRSAPQILTIAHFERCVDTDRPDLHAGGCRANKRLLERIDQQAILAWLE